MVILAVLFYFLLKDPMEAEKNEKTIHKLHYAPWIYFHILKPPQNIRFNAKLDPNSELLIYA